MALEPISVDPYLQWRCNPFGNLTTPPRVQCTTDPTYDLVKGDGETAATYPTFVDTDVDTGIPSHYDFDGVDDYISGWPEEMPDEYTVCAVVDTGDGPILWTSNDTTIENALTVSGAWDGVLYRLAIFSEEISADTLNLVEYWWVYRVPKKGAKGVEHRLILDGTCIAAVLSAETDPDEDRATGETWSETGVSYDNGAEFTGSDAGLRKTLDEVEEFSAIIFGEHDFSDGESGFLGASDGLYFKISVSSGTVTADFCGSILELPQGDVYAVTVEQDEKPKFYVDGKYIGEGSIIGPSGFALGNFVIGNRATSEELLFGHSNTTSLVSLNNDFHIYSEYDCSFDGYITKLRYYETYNGNLKPNLYIKNGSTYDLLWSNNDNNPISPGWNEIILDTSVSVLTGETYAIGYNADITTKYRMESGAILGYKSITYSTFNAPSSFDPGVDGYTVKTDGRVLPVEAIGYESHAFRGKLKKAMVFNRILNEHEIKSLYNRSRIG
jgi:hypothetical protein